MTRPLLVLTLVLAGCGGAEASREPVPPDPLDTISAEELYARGAELARVGDFVRAEQYLAASIERGYPESEAMPALMHVCVQASRLVAALEYAEPYLARHPNEWTLRMLVASIHMGLEHPERARRELERVLETAPEEPAQAHYFLGVLYRDELGDEQAAAGHFRRYLAIAPEGEHRDEARAGLPAEERGVPRRVPMPIEGEGGAEPGAGAGSDSDSGSDSGSDSESDSESDSGSD
ncbi:MAG TPA: tetratricopeptide repeat protein, partial [Sandaracinaceae bacterium LLY-WYZ-13_1]|nr:tetratricopeptide repeat protein [Sandaracinaceae bacterium LLY-WYZ-13_1]